MPTHFDLIITADHSNLTAEFRLLDATPVMRLHGCTSEGGSIANHLGTP